MHGGETGKAADRRPEFLAEGQRPARGGPPQAFAQVHEEELGESRLLHQPIEDLAGHLVEQRVLGGDDVGSRAGLGDQRGEPEALALFENLQEFPVGFEPHGALADHVEEAVGRPAALEDPRVLGLIRDLEAVLQLLHRLRFEPVERRLRPQEGEGVHGEMVTRDRGSGIRDPRDLPLRTLRAFSGLRVPAASRGTSGSPNQSRVQARPPCCPERGKPRGRGAL